MKSIIAITLFVALPYLSFSQIKTRPITKNPPKKVARIMTFDSHLESNIIDSFFTITYQDERYPHLKSLETFAIKLKDVPNVYKEILKAKENLESFIEMDLGNGYRLYYKWVKGGFGDVVKISVYNGEIQQGQMVAISPKQLKKLLGQ